MPSATVFAGFSLGGATCAEACPNPTRRAGCGAYHGGVPADTFGVAWPAAVALQLHHAEDDELSELDVAQDLARTAPAGELYVYPGESVAVWMQTVVIRAAFAAVCIQTALSPKRATAEWLGKPQPQPGTRSR
jgi:dienelactone hydrolase